MRDFSRLLMLPGVFATFLSVLSTPAYCEPWPFAPHERYWPEHEQHLKRDLEIQQRLDTDVPAGVRKMSDDEGEKFFMDYWQFGDTLGDAGSQRSNTNIASDRAVSSNPSFGNSSSHCDLLPPLLPHNDKQTFVILPRLFSRGLFERDFKCPGGTSSCASIGQPDTCCATEETCITVQNTGNGPVGCCPAGETCGGEVTGCNTDAGYTSCPGSANGGCCIPGYVCQGVGCVYTGSSTTTTTLPTATVTTGATTNEPTSVATTTTATSVPAASGTPVTSVQTVTTTIVSTPPASTAATTVTQTIVISPSISSTSASAPPTDSITTTSSTTSFVCTQGYHSCPVSLGGGCCPTDRSCASDRLCVATTTDSSSSSPTSSPTSTGSPAPPVRPTSGTTDASSETSTTTYSGCPTGFYMCSAYYLGGCCRVGRNCDTTSCPASDSTSVVVTSGLTIVAGGSGATSVSPPLVTITSTTTPGGTSTASDAQGTGTQGSCASAWFSCGADVGGGCCPVGFVCGASCTATVSGQSNIGKDNPSNDAVRGVIFGWGVVFVGLVTGWGMLLL
ncbi:hypothetical protein AAFC00_004493 [Neodothiora populina]|uniref:GPI anchored protein n=1 Tax=Neodothiora populina TaxID=2781224 RepID=A0ABR3P274_9PEZI